MQVHFASSFLDFELYNFFVVKNVNLYAVNLPILSLVALILVAWLRGSLQDFLGGPVVKTSPANAGDTGSIPGPGGFHFSQGNQACVPQLLPLGPGVRAPQQQKPPQGEAHTLQLESSPCSPQLEKTLT